ncbi:MAG: hypothetical protein IJX76_04260 [Clostridia bacterium]|nr:hypothetical protein [Clostridia bacterium]
MKTTLQKIYFGYVAAASLLTLVLAPLSILLERSWYHDFVSPVYFWGELLSAGIALGEWGNVLLAVLLLVAVAAGAILGLLGIRKWAAALILPILGGGVLLPLLLLLLGLGVGTLLNVNIAFCLSPVISVALLIFYFLLMQQR